MVGKESPPEKQLPSIFKCLLFTNEFSFNKALKTLGTPQIQMTFLHLFIILATSLAENLGIRTTPKEFTKGACIVIHRPNPWKLGRTETKDLPIKSFGFMHMNSGVLLAVKLKLLALNLMVLLSPVVEAL